MSSASARSSTARALTIAPVATSSSSTAVERELPVGAGAGDVVDPQVALEVADGQVGELERALVRREEVRRERGVADQAGHGPAVRGEREQRALGVVHRLRAGPGRPASRANAASSAWSSSSGSNQAAEPSAVASATPLIAAGAAAPGAGQLQAEPAAGRGVLGRARRASSPVASRTVSSSKPSSASGSADSTVA